MYSPPAVEPFATCLMNFAVANKTDETDFPAVPSSRREEPANQSAMNDFHGNRRGGAQRVHEIPEKRVRGRGLNSDVQPPRMAVTLAEGRPAVRMRANRAARCVRGG